MQMPGYFNGCVLTFLDYQAAIYSTRIVGWTANDPSNTSDYVARVMAVDGFQVGRGIEQNARRAHQWPPVQRNGIWVGIRRDTGNTFLAIRHAGSKPRASRLLGHDSL